MIQTIKVFDDRMVSPSRLVVGNRFENGIDKIQFELPENMLEKGYRYLILNKPSEDESYPIPLDENNIFYVDSRLTYYLKGVWIANVVLVKDEIKEDNLNPDTWTFISDNITLIVKSNYINNEYLGELPLPENLKIIYDDLLKMYETIKSDYENGNFNGQDGKTAFELAVENGFEGTEQKWLESLNGKPGKDGEPGKDGNPGFTPNIQIGTVTTLEPDQQATVERTGDNENPVFNFGIPRGKDGESGGSTADALQFAVKETSEGNPVVISDSAEFGNQGLELYGQSEQEVESKVQCIAPFEVQSIVKHLTVNYQSDKTNEMIITTTSGVTQYESAVIEFQLKAGAYIIKYDNLEGSFADYEFIQIKDSGSNVKATLSKTKKKSNFSISSDTLMTMAIFASTTELVTSELVTRKLYGLMISTQDVAWQPYIENSKPSPDNPSAIISNEISEIIIKKSLNLFDKSKIEKLKTITNDGNFEANASSHIRGYISVKPNTMYSMTGTNQTRGKFYTSDKKGIGMDYNFNPSKDTTFQTDENTYFIQFCLPASQDGSNIMLNEGDILAPYMDYSEEYQKITLTEPITLRGIPVDTDGNITIDGQQYISDILCEKDGIYGVERNTLTENYKGDSSEAWALQSINNNGIANFQIRFKQLALPSKFLLSNRFQYTTKTISSASEEAIFYNELVCFLRFKKERISTVELLKEWLSTNNVDVTYPLKQPTFEPLPQADQEAIRKLKTFYPNTVIDTGCFTKIKYVADTKLYIDKKISSLNTIQSELLEIKSKL